MRIKKQQRKVSMIIGIGIDMVESDRFLDWSAFKNNAFSQKKN